MAYFVNGTLIRALQTWSERVLEAQEDRQRVWKAVRFMQNSTLRAGFARWEEFAAEVDRDEEKLNVALLGFRRKPWCRRLRTGRGSSRTREEGGGGREDSVPHPVPLAARELRPVVQFVDAETIELRGKMERAVARLRWQARRLGGVSKVARVVGGERDAGEARRAVRRFAGRGRGRVPGLARGVSRGVSEPRDRGEGAREDPARASWRGRSRRGWRRAEEIREDRRGGGETPSGTFSNPRSGWRGRAGAPS